MAGDSSGGTGVGRWEGGEIGEMMEKRKERGVWVMDGEGWINW